MYKNAKSCVQNQNEYSEFFNSYIGVRQGENLSPLLFSIFLNDLAAFMSTNSEGIQIEFTAENIACYIKLYTLLYADDTILISESPEDLQCMLNALNAYCQKWKLQVNASKTKIVIFSRGRVKKRPSWTLGSQNLEVTLDYIYLGVTFNYNGKFTKAINKQITQAKRASFSMVAKARKLQLPIDIQMHLFDTCIMPILLYGSEVWGFSNTQGIEVFQSQFFKHILKLGTRSMNNLVLGELGRLKVEKYIKQRMLNFWVRIVTSKGNKVCLALYHKMRDLYDSGEYKSDWLCYINNTLSQLQLTSLWEADPGELLPNPLKNIFEEKLKYFYSHQWLTQIENSSACDTYSIFKTKIELEPYLLLLQPKFAIPLCKFRASNHRLPIVAGRFDNIPRNERVCDLCDSEEQADEYHYLFKCTQFSRERGEMINAEYTTNPNTLKMKYLFNSSDTQELVKLAKFVTIIMDHFKDAQNRTS